MKFKSLQERKEALDKFSKKWLNESSIDALSDKGLTEIPVQFNRLDEGLDKLVKKEFNLLLLRNYKDVTPSDFVETILETIIEFSPKSKGSDGVDYTGAWSTGVISAFERLLKSKNWVVK